MNHALQNLLETAIFTEKPFSNAFAGIFSVGENTTFSVFMLNVFFVFFASLVANKNVCMMLITYAGQIHQ